jgi:hypothetical protein
MWKRQQQSDMYTIGFQAQHNSVLDTDNWPTMKVVRASSNTTVETVEGINFPARLEGENFLAFFTYLTFPYVPAKYLVVLTATDQSGNVRKEVHQLEILPGGGPMGNVIASHYNGLPEAHGVIYQLDGGVLERKSNPR